MNIKIIPHDSQIFFLWNVIVGINSLIGLALIPIVLIGETREVGFFVPLELMVVTVFIFDILVRFRTSIFEKGLLLLSPHEIKTYYRKNDLKLDLLCSTPFILLSYYIPEPFSNFVAFLSLFRFYKFFKIFNFLNEANPKIPLIFLPSLLSLVAHWIACFWFILHHDRSNFFENYINSLYWTIMTLTSVGYGDIVPETILEKIFASGVMVVGFSFYGLVIGQLSSVLVSANNFKQAKRKKINDVLHFFDHYKIPSRIRREVLNYYYQLYGHRLSVDDSQIINDLPTNLQSKLQIHMNLSLIKKVPFFENLDIKILEEISKILTHHSATPGETLAYKGDLCTEILFIAHGTVELIGENEKKIKSLSSGSYFGHKSLLEQKPIEATVTTSTYCDYYKLTYEDFHKLELKFAGLHHQILQNLES